MFENDKFNKRKISYLLKKVSLNRNLRAKEYKLLLFLLPELRKGKYIEVYQAEISRQTGMTPSQVSKAMTNLYKENIINYKTRDNSWRKEICLIVEDFEAINDEINELISINTGNFYDDDDDDDDDDDL